MHRTKYPVRRVAATVSKAAGSLAVFLWLALTQATVAYAQVEAPDSEIPENAPKNWSIQFVAEPVLALAVVVVVLCAVIYAWRMIRLRYPRPS
jgi:hypothetical protein